MLDTVFVWIQQQEIYVQPIAAHDFTIYLFDTHTSCYATFEESWCVEHLYSLWYTAQI